MKTAWTEAACICKSVSMFTPKAFSIRSAISGDSDVFSFTRSESVTRRTPSTSAPVLTLRPCGSRISSRMNAPGCSGFIPTFAIVLPISDSPPDLYLIASIVAPLQPIIASAIG